MFSYTKELIFIFLLVIVSLFSCNNKQIISIKGKIKGAENKYIVLENIGQKIDTISIVKIDKNGNFEFELDSINNSFQRLKLDNNNMIYLKIKNGDKIIINTSMPQIAKNYSIEGSEDSELLRQMHQYLLLSLDSLNELKKIISKTIYNNIDTLTANTETKIKQLISNNKNYLIHFINNHKKSPCIYMALYQYLGFNPVFNIEYDFNIFDSCYQNLELYNPKLEQLKLLESDILKYKLKQKSQSSKAVMIGDFAPIFELKDNNNNLVSLNNFIGYKLYIVFWSSWSKESLSVIRTLSKKDYKLILISLDTNPSKWKESINKNNLINYINLCDFKSWESSIIKTFNVEHIPLIIELDTEGKIVKIGNGLPID